MYWIWTKKKPLVCGLLKTSGFRYLHFVRKKWKSSKIVFQLIIILFFLLKIKSIHSSLKVDIIRWLCGINDDWVYVKYTMVKFFPWNSLTASKYDACQPFNRHALGLQSYMRLGAYRNHSKNLYISKFVNTKNAIKRNHGCTVHDYLKSYIINTERHDYLMVPIISKGTHIMDRWI